MSHVANILCKSVANKNERYVTGTKNSNDATIKRKVCLYDFVYTSRYLYIHVTFDLINNFNGWKFDYLRSVCSII